MTPVAQDRLLKQTTSRCPQCHRACPAEVVCTSEKPARVFLKRACPVHGETSACLASDARFYWLARGKAENSCCSGSACCASTGAPAGTLGLNAAGRNGSQFETLSTCLALIEIVNSCNLSCPTCYADSPFGIGQTLDFVPLENLQSRIQGVIDRKGKIEILQLSGGEPTLHPRFFDLLEWVQTKKGVDYVLLNTNGVRIATDDEFARQLATAAGRRRIQLYLQFDGSQLEGQQTLRGTDLRELRARVIERCSQMNLPVTLAMTVTAENLPFLWQAIEFGLRFPHIRGITFQPKFNSGRVRSPALNRQDEKVQPVELRPLPVEGSAGNVAQINTADIVLAAVGQSGGRLRAEDFTPLPCGDPNCATIGYLLKTNGQVRSVSEFMDFSKLHGFLRDKVRYNLGDLVRCGCESEPLGDLLKKFEMNESHTFRLFIKPFMDAWTWDEDRIDRCCTHVIRPDGQLDSFCRYYSGFADCAVAP